MCTKKIANNWECSIEAQHFKYRYLTPLNKKFEEARTIMLDTNRKWQNGDKKEKAKKFALMEVKVIDFNSFYHSTMELAEQHENLVTMLSELYNRWFFKVSHKGLQSKNMLSMQKNELESIFSDIFEALKPLELSIEPPKKQKE